MDDIVRVGEVTEVKTSDRTVRVHFPDVDIVSDWLKVLRTPPFIPKKGETQQTKVANMHTHEVKIEPWFPNIGDIVLCLYNPGFNEDGYVVGGL